MVLSLLLVTLTETVTFVTGEGSPDTLRAAVGSVGAGGPSAEGAGARASDDPEAVTVETVLPKVPSPLVSRKTVAPDSPALSPEGTPSPGLSLRTVPRID